MTDNLGTLDKFVQVYNISTGASVQPETIRATTNTTTVGFGVAPTTNQFRVLVG